MRVVICDDEPLARERLTRIVREEGHEVVAQAATGLEAIAKVKETVPDVILLDIRMPEMDGIEAATRLRADDRYAFTPIIALTADSMVGDKEKSLAAGMNDHLSKPVEPDELLAKLREWVDRGRNTAKS